MNDRIGTERLVSRLFVFGVDATLIVINKTLPSRKEHMAAIALENNIQHFTLPE